MANYGYIRVSTETQAEHGQGLDTQREAIKKYCKSNGLELATIYEDSGISGTIADRPALLEMLSELQSGDKIIVLNTSRMWRNDTVKVLTRREIEKVGADIVSIEQPNYSIYATDPNDFLINSIMEILDQYDRMQISKKLATGRKTKARKGSKACGSAPIGYKWENEKIVIDFNNNLIVCDIFNKYLEFGTLSKVVAYCEEMHYKTKTGASFSKKSIANILHNDFYIGIVTHAGLKSVGEHEPIVSTELFHKTQEKLSR